MASRVEGLDEKIIECAKKEFLQKGFADASLRTIAQCAGTSIFSIVMIDGDTEGVNFHLKPALAVLTRDLGNMKKRTSAWIIGLGAADILFAAVVVGGLVVFITVLHPKTSLLFR